MAKKRTVEKNGLVYKEFQKQVSALKKAGLVPKTLDVRKVKPTKHYKGLVSKYKDIATGSAKVAAIPNPAVIETLEARGESIIKKGGKAFLKARQQVNQRGQIVNPFTVRVTKRGEVVRRYRKTTPEGKPVYITQRELPIKFENMEQWLTELKAAGFQLQPGEQIYFTFNGNYSRRTYASFDEAFNKFMTYDIIIDAVAGKLKVEDEADLVKSVGFQRISGPEAKAYNRNRIVLPDMQFSQAAKKKYKRRQKRGYGSKGV